LTEEKKESIIQKKLCEKGLIMKKIFCLFTLAVAVLVLLLTLSACGDETPATTTAALTTAPETTPAGSKPAVTTPAATTSLVTTPEVTIHIDTMPVLTTPVSSTDNTPVELEPTSISYTMSLGGFFYTQFDDAGRTSVRYVYDRDTMKKTGREYRYYYDAAGKMTKITLDTTAEIMEYTVTYEADGKTAIASYVKDPSHTYRLTFDENGKIITEETLLGDEVVFGYEYNADGYIVMETMYFRGTAIEYETVYDDDMALIVCELPNAATELSVIYNEAGYPLSLEGTQLNTEYWHTYTYNQKMLCTSANFIDGNYEYFYIYTYDDKDRVATMVEESDDGIHEEQYAYDEKDQVIRLQVSDSAHSGELNYYYVTTYAYDDMGRCIKTVSYEDGDEETYSTKWTYCHIYNEEGLLAVDTADFTTSDDGFIASFKDTYEYDSFGREIRDTMIEYDEKKNVLNKNVFESEYDENCKRVKEIIYLYDNMDVLVDQKVIDHTA